MSSLSSQAVTATVQATMSASMDAIKAKLNKPLFDTNLTDLVRGIRANKRNESAFISEQIQLIREELRQSNPAKKANAIQKLTYLEMLGYDISWAAFNVVEVMSNPKYTIKRVGYLAATQSFHDGTDVLMLITNLLKKDMATKNIYDAGLALNCLATVCTPDLARDLAADVVALLSHSKPYIRKRAVLALYRIFVRFPDSLRPSFPRLRDRLTDAEPSVSSAAVNVVCELARRNPKNYLSLAPTFFEILSAGQSGSASGSRPSNWTLIKIIKLFAALAPLEPRLAKLLVEPMHALINSTPAMSLLYECIQTCISGLSGHLPTMKLCVQRLRTMAEDPDANLKYLALAALYNIMQVHPKAVAEHRDMVMACLDDSDPSIRARALDLLTGMTTRKNLREVAARLSDLAGQAEGTARDDLIARLVELCRSNQYQHVTDFEWYLQLINDLALLQGMKQGKMLAEQIMEVNIRVKVVRPFGVRLAATMLRDARLISSAVEGGACEVLDASAWVLGEFYAYTCSSTARHAEAVEALLQPRAATLPAHVQATFMHAALKIFARLASPSQELPEELAEDEYQAPTAEDAAEVAELLATRLPLFSASSHLEVQERACFALEVVKLHAEVPAISLELAALFDEPLLPVAKGAQRKVAVPEGLDLDTPFFAEDPKELEEDTVSDDQPGAGGAYAASAEDWAELKKIAKSHEQGEDAGSSAGAKRKQPRRPAVDSVYMLGSADGDEDDDIPVTNISENLGPLRVSGSGTAPGSASKASSAARKKKVVYKVDTLEDAPEGAVPAARARRGARQDEKDKTPEDALAAISLDEPLRADEELPVQQHHVVKSAPVKTAAAAKPSSAASSPASKAAPAPARPGSKANPSPYILGGSDSPAKKATTAPQKASAPRTASLIDLGTGSPTGSPKPAPRAVSESPRTRGKTLCKDSNVEIAYELRSNPAEPAKFLATVRVSNKCDAEVGMFIFSAAESEQVAMARGAKIEKAAFTVLPGATSPAHNLLFTFKGIPASPMAVRGTIKYQVRGRGPQSVDFSLAVPASTFVQPTPITKEEIAALIKSEGANLALATAAIASSSPSEAIAVAAQALHIDAVTGAGGRLFYGKTIQGLHVCVLMKEKDGKVQFDFKCNNQALAQSLATEVTQFFS